MSRPAPFLRAFVAGALAWAITAQAAPYKDVTRHATPEAPRLAALNAAGQPVPLPSRALHGGLVAWAFASGECGQEHWGGFDAQRFAALNVPAFEAAGVRYMLSTGGEAGVFTCGSDEGLARFIDRYTGPMLAGVDFDIEGRQTPAQIDALAARAAALQRSRPALQTWFTLATHAGSDAARRGLNATGRQALAALKRHGARRAIINLMVMNYGPADRRFCVLREGAAPPACDMGRSALQAAENLHRRYGWPYAQIAVTAMLGENDVAGNVFTLEDATLLREGAKRLGLAGVHGWSLDRDRPCEAGSPRVSPTCHGLPGVPAGAFGRALGDIAP